MRSFFKIFFASLLSLIAFVIIFVLVISIWVARVSSSSAKDDLGSNGVLVIDLAQTFSEKSVDDPAAGFSEDRYNTPGVYDVIRLIRYAKGDSAIRGILLKVNGNNNGMGTSEEIRDALIDFKTSKKFLYAYGDVIPMRAYYVASVADRIYCNPKGGVEWKGLTSTSPYLKGMLDKLELQPEIFYAGKFKSATEPLRSDKMTEPNRVQLTALLGDIFNHILSQIAEARSLDTAVLRKAVDEMQIQEAGDALRFKLVDGLKYNDELLDEIMPRLKASSITDINQLPLGKYFESVKSKIKPDGRDRIALIYAQGTITGGKADQESIGEDSYRQMIRKARLDNGIKAIVLRINSGGGSALVSENLWRELTLAKNEKPVVISFGDVSASGGYYLSCNADSIFADPMTITGSIGVFALTVNAQSFFKNKLGVTFDGVQTAKQPDAMSIVQPLTPMQKKLLQSGVDSIYSTFKTRVADGRHKSVGYVDSIAQGRVWSGEKAVPLGLVDRMGGIEKAIECAARLAKTSNYRLREFPEPKGVLEQLLSRYGGSAEAKAQAVKETFGAAGMPFYNSFIELQQMGATPQARLPFAVNILD